MPVLHKYKAKQEYYILTRLNGSIITFQITPEGRGRLAEAGVEDGQQFSRSLLLELCKSGDAYTGGTAADIDLSGWVQITLDFSDDPVPESSVPVCASCGSPYGLHLVSVLEAGQAPFFSIRCDDCCSKQRIQLGICVPAPALTRPLMKRIMGFCHIDELDAAAGAYLEMLEQSYLDRLIKAKPAVKPVQESLFGTDGHGQGKLL
ncbi:MAG: hypothetical protein AB7U43_00695 [Desulfobacter sp.]